MASGNDAAEGQHSYRRSTNSPRGRARREDLLAKVTDDIAANGLVGFSLRRAARAAGTTHKVLLYHFVDADELLALAVENLRGRRITEGLSAAAEGRRLADKVRAIWPVLANEGSWVHDQAIGLMMYDPSRYGQLGSSATEQYLKALVSICPPRWTDRRKLEVSEMILGTLRGFVIDRLTPGGSARIAAGLDALCRSVDREERARS